MAPVRFIVIGGPTASGKSELALTLAEHFDGEIVNADSRQVYRYLDIGTAKPTARERERVPHHLLDIVDPRDSFDAAAFAVRGRAALQDVAARGRLPIVVGGTGLYIRALRGGLVSGPAAVPQLRAELESLDRQVPGLLHRWCRRLDPQIAVRIHENDRVRLVRALEVVLVKGVPLSRLQQEHGFLREVGPSLYLCIDPGREVLAARIYDRSRRMFAAGLVEEVRELRAQGYDPELRVLQSIGYREASTIIDGQRTKEEATDDLVRSTLRFAKRQRTWFRAESDARMISEPGEAFARVERFLAKEQD